MTSVSEVFDEPNFARCAHVEQAAKLVHCGHCNYNFCEQCATCHKDYLFQRTLNTSTDMLPEAPSVALAAKLMHASQLLDEDLFIIKQQIGSTIDAIVERFSTYLWSQGSKILGEAEEKVTAEKMRLKAALDNVDMVKLDSDADELKLRLQNFKSQGADALSFEQLSQLSRDVTLHTQITHNFEDLLNVGHRVRVGFDLNTELEEAVQAFDSLKLGAVNVAQTGGICLPVKSTQSESTDASYNKVTLMSVFHGNDAFGDPIYLPHAITALPDSHMVAVLHGEYRISLISCPSVAPMCVIATYHLQHPNNAPAPMPLHNIAADKTKLYLVGDARGTFLVTVPIDESSSVPDRRTVVPKTFAKSWSDRGFRGLAVGVKARWLYTADGDTITAYSLDSVGAPTFRRIANFPSNFEPYIYDVFPDGVTLVYTSKANRKTIYWRAFPTGEDSRKNSEILKSSRHYENHRETNFGGAAVDYCGNLILCDDRSLQVFYRYSVDIPVSTFPLPMCHDDPTIVTHSIDARGMAILSAGINLTPPEDMDTFKESCSAFVVVPDCAPHRLVMYKISG